MSEEHSKIPWKAQGDSGFGFLLDFANAVGIRGVFRNGP